jgi:hypothetical protein
MPAHHDVLLLDIPRLNRLGACPHVPTIIISMLHDEIMAEVVHLRRVQKQPKV